MRWEVRVRGDTDDLDSLCTVMTHPEASLTRSGKDYVLSSTRFQESTQPEDVLRIASSILDVLSGTIKVVMDSRRPLEIAGVSKVHDDGSPAVQFIFPASVESATRFGRARITHADGTETVSTPADPLLTWFTVAIKDDAVASALERLRDPDSWGGLYNVYEIVRDDVGGDDAIHARGWATKAECTRFRRTACSPAVLGRKARHGVQNSEAPLQPMKASEASAFIRSLVHRWITEKTVAQSNG